LVWDTPYLGLAAAELAADARNAFQEALAVWISRDTAPALTVSLAAVAMPIQSGFDAVDQDGPSEGLGQEANGSGLQRSGADALIGEGRDKNKRRVVTPNAHVCQKVQTAHSGHLHIRNDTQRFVQLSRLQEILGRRKCMDQISMRAEKIIGRGADGCIVVND
jgi:hypothetical protein